jgi:hypothetical protein
MRWADMWQVQDEKSGACGVLGGGNLKERDRLEHVGVDWRIFKWVFKKYDGVVEWTDLAQDRDKWRALLNAVMKLRSL